MSDYSPSYFAEQSEHDQGDLLDPSIVDESNLDYLFAEVDAPAYQDRQVGNSNAITEITEDDFSAHEGPQAGLINEGSEPEIDYDELQRDQEAIALMLQTIAANEPGSLDDANESLPVTEQGPQYEVSESEDQGRAPSLKHDNPENDPANQRFRKDEKEVASAGLGHGQPGFQFDLDTPGPRSDPVNHTITWDSSSLRETVVDHDQRVQRRLQKAKQTESSKPKDRRRRPAVQKQDRSAHHVSSLQDDLDTSAPGQTVEDGEGSIVNSPGVDSGYGTLNPSPEATDPASPGQDTKPDNEGGKKVRKVRAEADPDFDPAHDLYYYPEDPKTGVIESRRREGWGRTGMRKEVEVWFNPDTKEWRTL